MFRLPCIFILLLFSCSETRRLPVCQEKAMPFEKVIILQAGDQSAANEAQTIISYFYPPSRFEITEHNSGHIDLRFCFAVNDISRYNQMKDRLEELPGLTILKES